MPVYDPTLRNPDPAYLRMLIDRTGLSQREAARRIGISDRVMRQYLANRSRKTALKMPYPIQYALELLAESAEALDQLAQTSEELGGY